MRELIQSLDDITSQTVIFIVYGAAFFVVLMWVVVSLSQSRGLANHPGSVCMRALVNFVRTADRTAKQTDELYGVLTRNKNDIVMLFFMYCRMYGNFKSIQYYLNYRSYKMINKKQKPWGFSVLIIVTLVATFMFSYSFFVGFRTPIETADASSILLAAACPLGLLLMWLSFLVLILMKYKMYWVEFENMFRKVNELSYDFFATQEAYYDEFADNILKLTPMGGIKRRIERIIARTDPEELSARAYTSFARPNKKAAAENGETTDPNAAAVPNAAGMPTMPDMKNFPGGVRIVKPHPETEAYLQAHAQITQQLMQMMMQQSMQQTQIVQRALTSQQALANSVVQQNIMAMRLENQQTALRRPDFGKMPADAAFPWAANPFTDGKGMPDSDGAIQKQPQAAQEIKPDAVEILDGPKPGEDITIEAAEIKPESASTPPAKTKEDKLLFKKLQAAFEMLSPPPDENAEPDPVFIAPDREQLNIEKRLGEFFSAKVYVYDEGEV